MDGRTALLTRLSRKGDEGSNPLPSAVRNASRGATRLRLIGRVTQLADARCSNHRTWEFESPLGHLRFNVAIIAPRDEPLSLELERFLERS